MDDLHGVAVGTFGLSGFGVVDAPELFGQQYPALSVIVPDDTGRPLCVRRPLDLALFPLRNILDGLPVIRNG